MSTTFQPAGVKQILVPTPCDMEGCCAADRCGYCEDGIMMNPQHDGPSVNFHGAGAAAILRLLGLYDPEDSSLGSVPVDQIGALRQKVLVAKNSPRSRKPELVACYTDATPGRATAHYGSIDDDGLLRRLEDMDVVLAACQARQEALRWF